MHNPVVTSLFCVCLKYTCAESVYPVYAVSYLDSQDLGEIMAVGGHGERGARAYYGGLRRSPQWGLGGRAPGQWATGGFYTASMPTVAGWKTAGAGSSLTLLLPPSHSSSGW